MLRSIPNSRNENNAVIDILRLCAVFPVVQVHAYAPLGFLNIAGVGFFAISMTWFILQKINHISLERSQVVIQRLNRLMVPFFIWFFLYLVLKILDAVYNNEDPLEQFLAWIPPQGHFAQLWYLPWAALVSVALIFLFSKERLEYLEKFSLKHNFYFLIFCLLLITFITFGGYGRIDVKIADLFLMYIPSVICGICLFAVRSSTRIFILSGVIFSISGALIWALGYPGGQQLAIATPLLVIGIMIPFSLGKFGSKISQLSFDIYLCHLLVIAISSKALGISKSTWAGSLINFCACILFAVAMQVCATAFQNWQKRRSVARLS